MSQFSFPKIPVDETATGPVAYVPLDISAPPQNAVTVRSSLDVNLARPCVNFDPVGVDNMQEVIRIDLGFERPYTIGE